MTRPCVLFALPQAACRRAEHATAAAAIPGRRACATMRAVCAALMATRYVMPAAAPRALLAAMADAAPIATSALAMTSAKCAALPTKPRAVVAAAPLATSATTTSQTISAALTGAWRALAAVAAPATVAAAVAVAVEPASSAISACSSGDNTPCRQDAVYVALSMVVWVSPMGHLDPGGVSLQHTSWGLVCSAPDWQP